MVTVDITKGPLRGTHRVKWAETKGLFTSTGMRIVYGTYADMMKLCRRMFPDGFTPSRTAEYLAEYRRTC